MTRRTASALAMVTAVSVALAFTWSRTRISFELPAPRAVSSGGNTNGEIDRAAPGFSERTQRDTEIRVWGEALAADPVSALVMGQLAALHLQRAREGGQFADYVEAEQLARRSLATRRHRNASTVVTLVNTLLAQHRFAEAEATANELVLQEPDEPAYRALLGEIAMETGDDDTARRMFASVSNLKRSLSVAPRLARWMELNGDVAGARTILLAARAEAMVRSNVTREAKAWFNLRVGELELRAGRERAAAKAFRAGLAIERDDPRLLTAMARLALVQGNADAAIAWSERALEVALDPATLIVMSDALRSRGDSARAAETDATLDVVVAGQTGPYHRAWSLHLLDQDRRVQDVVQQAQAELAERKDVYGYDVAAWAYFRAGRMREARALMTQALRLGTTDPLLLSHAQAIDAQGL